MTKQDNPNSGTRKIRAGFFISLDGVVEAPNLWQKNFDDDMSEEMEKVMTRQDAFLMGKQTYEEWAEYWPTHEDDPFGSYINNIQKYVVSSTLDKVSWGNYDNITLFSNLDQVKKLRTQEGGDIGMSGSATLVRSLLKAGLLDELFLMIHPVIVGKGAKLFEDDFEKDLELTYTRGTSSGTIVATYIPKEGRMDPLR